MPNTNKPKWHTQVKLSDATTPEPKFGTREYAKWLTERIDKGAIERAEKQGQSASDRLRFAQIRRIIDGPSPRPTQYNNTVMKEQAPLPKFMDYAAYQRKNFH